MSLKQITQRLFFHNGAIKRAVKFHSKFLQQKHFSTTRIFRTVVASPYGDIQLPDINLGHYILNKCRPFGSKVAFVSILTVTGYGNF